MPVKLLGLNDGPALFIDPAFAWSVIVQFETIPIGIMKVDRDGGAMVLRRVNGPFMVQQPLHG